MTGRHFSEFVLPADRPRVLRDFLKAAKDGKSPPVLSYRLRRKDGSYSLIEQTSTIVNDPERGTILTGSMRDLTEARRVENLISETEEKYKTLFDNANSAIFIADTGTGLLTDVNKNAEKLTGRTREELIGMHQSRLHPAGLRSHYKQVFRRHSKSPGPQLDTAQVLRKDGSLVPVIIRGATIRVGNVTYLQGIFTGISAQKKAEAGLEEALSLNRQIIANAKDGVIVYDRDMRTNAGTSLP